MHLSPMGTDAGVLVAGDGGQERVYTRNLAQLYSRLPRHIHFLDGPVLFSERLCESQDSMLHSSRGCCSHSAVQGCSVRTLLTGRGSRSSWLLQSLSQTEIIFGVTQGLLTQASQLGYLLTPSSFLPGPPQVTRIP